MRKLASIQIIQNIEPIPNADAIDVATVLGWRVVVKKNEFKVGDLVVYCEIDSLFPNKPEFAFLESKHFRIKTVKFRGQISQGIVFPISILPHDYLLSHNLCIGDDVTEVIGVTKYEAPIPVHLSGMIKGSFPAFLIKTDETRIQSVPSVLDRHKGKIFIVSEKLDGTSMTTYLRDGEFGVCSRNMELKEEGDTAYWKVARDLALVDKMKCLGFNVSFQGELIGWGIQGNKYKLPPNTLAFKIFSVFNIDTYKFISYAEYAPWLMEMKLETVPIVDSAFQLNHTVEELLKHAEGKSALCKDTEREGNVYRPLIEERDDELGRLSFKVISNRFLLKNGE